MSCRTTPAGSLATTFVQRLYGLEDGQCTSLFHELRRTYNEAEGILPPVDPSQYSTALNSMETSIRHRNEWSSALRDRALRRLEVARAAGMPADPGLAWATAHMTAQASDLRSNLNELFTEIAAAKNVRDTSLIAGEFHRLYTAYSEARRNPAHTLFDERDSRLTQDDATRYAVGVLRGGLRCGTCGQFRGVETHTCPPEGHRPLLIGLTIPQPEPASVADNTVDETLQALRRLVPSQRVVMTRCGDCDEAYPASDYHECASYDEDYDDEDEDTDWEQIRRAQREAQIRAIENPNGQTPVEGPDRFSNPDLTPLAPEVFQEAYDAAKARIAAGDLTVPVITNPLPGQVTGGLGSRIGGNSFGLEIEIDFPEDDYPYNSRELFAQALHREGIVQSPFVQRWHFVGDDRPGGDYTESANGWICEFDRSVDDVDGERGVEIKSQILYDEPETWHNLDRICAIARELGGKPTMRTGLHVNVGGANFPSENPDAHNALLRMAGAYDDTIVRMAHNPVSGPRHRGRSFCGYAPIPPQGFNDVATARAYSNHYQAFNLGHLPAAGERHRSSSRVEVRVWDSALDPGRIQAQVTASLAMIKLATEGEAPGQPVERAGAHRSRFGTQRLSGEQWEESTESFRRFVSLMKKAGAGSDLHLAQFTSLFAASRWQQN
jgi:hypothetical protein